MASENQGRTLRDVYYDDLREFWDACGTPTLRPLSKISKQLGELYGDQYRNLPSLPRTTLSDLLNGRREGFPGAELVSSFVLSCQRFAWLAGVTHEDPGPASLPEWHERLRIFKKLGAGTPADSVRDLLHRDADAVRTEPEPPPDPQVSEPADGQHADHGAGRTLTQQRFHDRFGPYGLQVLAAAEDRHDPDAAYRVALLLYLEGCPREALVWLIKAVRADHFLAARLNESDDPVAAAAGHAFSLGSLAFAADDLDIAQIFYERAARNGHVEAAFELGLLLMDTGEPTHATYWFNMAAEGGHEYARSRFEEIHRLLLGEAFEPPRPYETDLPSPSPMDDVHPAADDPEATPPFGLPAS